MQLFTAISPDLQKSFVVLLCSLQHKRDHALLSHDSSNLATSNVSNLRISFAPV